MNPIKIILHILKVIALLLLALCGTMIILSYFNVGIASMIRARVLSIVELALYGGQVSSIFLACILIIPFIIMIINFFIPDINSSKYISIEDASGYIHVSIKAISDYVRQIATSYKDIESARPKLFYKNGNIEILLYLEVSSKQNVVGLSEILKADIVDKLTKTITISSDNIGNIEIVVENIKLDNSPTRKINTRG